jgi:hypothetical protein
VVRATALTPGPVAIVIRLYLARGWRTDLPRLVLLLQAGNAVSFFGYGLILPFEIIYLRQIRRFATATAGLVLATILGTATSHLPGVARRGWRALTEHLNCLNSRLA